MVNIHLFLIINLIRETRGLTLTADSLVDRDKMDVGILPVNEGNTEPEYFKLTYLVTGR